MAKREGSSAPSCSRARKKAAKEGKREAKIERDARDFESAQRLLEKLSPEVWGKILDNVDENDLFPLALELQVLSSEAEGAGGADEAARPR